MSLVPFQLPEGCSVLVAGAGGGYDFVCGLPIALELESRGHPVHLANYSFTELSAVSNARWHSEHLLEVGADASSAKDYFPEQLLADWYRKSKKQERPVWCFGMHGVVPTRDSYRYLVQRLGIHAVVCVDGGIDGIFRGDETDLGTPSMDTVSVMAAHLSGAPVRVYATTAFGVEGAEGTVSHAQALHRMAELMHQNAALGAGLLHPGESAGAQFLDAVKFMTRRLPDGRQSTMVGSLAAAAQGAYGPTVVNHKTGQRPPWLSPLTSLFWYFQADAVARLKLCYEDILETRTVVEVGKAFEAVRSTQGIRPYESIPI
ncbi:MAG: DUF1152 domain-containing protein [Pseudomonadota bacterium]